jgi:hypothetical protein
MIPAPPFNLMASNQRQILAEGAALRRVPAKFRGLLRSGRNRKKRPSDSSRLPWKQVKTLDLAGETTLIIRRLMVPFALAALAFLAAPADRAGAQQGAFPAPLPGQMNQPPANDPAFPPVNGRPVASMGAAPTSSFPVNGAAPVGSVGGNPAFDRPAGPPQGGPSEACMKGFMPLREEAERRGKLIKAASDRHAAPDEACKLIGSYGQAEISMIKYVESHTTQCGIPPQVTEQLKTGHKSTEALEKKVCNAAQQAQQHGPAGPTLSEVLGSAASLPEATHSKKGGSTFDTLNGNVLSR